MQLARLRSQWRLCLALLLIAYLPFLMAYAGALWRREHYRHFPLVWAGAWILMRRRIIQSGGVAGCAPARGAITTPWVALALLTFTIAVAIWSPLLGYVSCLALVAGISLALGGREFTRLIVPSLVLACTVIHPPFDLDTRAGLWLRQLVVSASSITLDRLHIDHVLLGTVIEIPGQQLFVEQACSGIVSICFAISFSVFLGFWHGRRPLRIALLACMGCSFVILGNVLRIVVVTVAANRFGVDLLHGWPHEALGVVLLLSYVLLIASADALIDCFRRPKPRSLLPTTNLLINNLVLDLLRLRLLQAGVSTHQEHRRVALAGLFCVLGVSRAMLTGLPYLPPKAAPTDPPRAGASLKPQINLPNAVSGWRKDSREDAVLNRSYLASDAVNTVSWSYSSNDISCQIALSYPYPARHDLAICYTNTGWIIEARRNLQPRESQERSISVLSMTRKPFTVGHLLYDAFDTGGRYEPEPRALGRLHLNLSLPSRNTPPPGNGTYQVQALAVSHRALNPDEERAVLDLFLATCDQVRRQTIGAPQSTGSLDPAPAPAHPTKEIAP